jgi:hypothetical protein
MGAPPGPTVPFDAAQEVRRERGWGRVRGRRSIQMPLVRPRTGSGGRLAWVMQTSSRTGVQSPLFLTSFRPSVASVPEPGRLTLLSLGLATIAVRTFGAGI